eukprot:scaffold110355_cov31-Tisochrysis_lutea.AAC.9
MVARQAGVATGKGPPSPASVNAPPKPTMDWYVLDACARVADGAIIFEDVALGMVVCSLLHIGSAPCAALRRLA